MTGDKYSVNIKSNSGARIQGLNSQVNVISKQNTQLTTCDAILLHIGINNISDSETPSDIIGKYENLISSVKKINKTAKIIISSIIPKKSETEVSQPISEVNRTLKSMCDNDATLYFLDNTPRFTSRNTTNTSLFTNEVHLSSKGAAYFASNIMAAINSCLKTGYNTQSSTSSGNFPQTRRKTKGQQQQTKGRGKQGMYPMPPPPWMWMFQPQPPQYY